MQVWVSMIIGNPKEYKQCHHCRAILIKEVKKCHACGGNRFTIVTKEKIANLKDLQKCNGDMQIEVS